MAFVEEKDLTGAVDETNPADPVAMESTDDIDLADRLREGRTQMVAELRKLIIDRWLPILNRRITHWLDILELPHHVTFHPDLSITIMLFHEEFDYGNLSKGERTRLRVALNFAFQDVFEFQDGGGVSPAR